VDARQRGGAPVPGDGGNHHCVDRDARGLNPRCAVASSPVTLPDGAASLASMTVSRPAQHPQSSSGIPSRNQHRSMAARFNTWMPGGASNLSRCRCTTATPRTGRGPGFLALRHVSGVEQFFQLVFGEVGLFAGYFADGSTRLVGRFGDLGGPVVPDYRR
jgi:hypothetical protein